MCGAEVADGVSINAGARIFGTGLVSIGADTWVGIGCTLVVPHDASVRIGARCDIAPDVLFECGSHRIGGPGRRAGEGCSAPITIGAGSWIGARVVLLGGVEVGPGSLVAAGAVVRPGVYPAQALLAAVPARVVRHFADEMALEAE
jgi:acetyltransferase-like isoleucine patch superfamily enzyme